MFWTRYGIMVDQSINFSVSIWKEKEKQVWSSPRVGRPFASPLLPEELHGTDVYLGLSHCFLQHCAWAPGLPDKLASFPVWTTIQGFYMLLLQKSSSPAECCGCWQEIKHWGSDCSSEPTGQLSSLGSLLSWTTVHGPSAGVPVGLEGCGDIMGVTNQRLKLRSYLEV